ncbi:MAG TPA: hypothetical protein VH231_15075 [Solirubrobacteraceae bacterium]|nr:hypothetical protein [Solirubrobacteraceae bacterium]
MPRHQASAAGEVKSTGEPVPIHHLATSGLPSAAAAKCPSAAARE